MWRTDRREAARQRLLGTLGHLWGRFPDWRFGQMLDQVLAVPGVPGSGAQAGRARDLATVPDADLEALTKRALGDPVALAALREESAGTPVRPGLYRHFKGSTYEVLFTAQHSETGEWFVVYRTTGRSAPAHYTRPEPNFREAVTRDGVPRPRFTYLGPGGSAHPDATP